MTLREHMIRGAFSFVGAAATLYMASEYFEEFQKSRRREALAVSVACLGLSAMEASKVGYRLKSILGLSDD
jgi:hypothetical protein